MRRSLVRFFLAMIQWNWIKARAADWQRFWYTPQDPTTLGVLRWLVGAMLVYTHIVWGLELQAMFGSQGWHRPELMHELQQGVYSPSFWWYVPDQYLWPVHITCVTILVLFMIGFATPITSVLAIAINTSYCYRALLATYGLDQGNAILLAYLTVGGCGQALSVDRVLGRWWARRRGRELVEPFLQPEATTRANLAYRLIQVHYCIVYLAAGTSKLQGEAWWNGNAIWQAIGNMEYQSRDLTWLAWYPWVIYGITHLTIAWEISFSALVWRPSLRNLMLFIGFIMHLGIGAFMGMWTFGSIMFIGYLGFLPDVVNPLVQRLGGLPSVPGALGWSRAKLSMHETALAGGAMASGAMASTVLNTGALNNGALGTGSMANSTLSSS